MLLLWFADNPEQQDFIVSVNSMMKKLTFFAMWISFIHKWREFLFWLFFSNSRTFGPKFNLIFEKLYWWWLTRPMKNIGKWGQSRSECSCIVCFKYGKHSTLFNDGYGRVCSSHMHVEPGWLTCCDLRPLVYQVGFWFMLGDMRQVLNVWFWYTSWTLKKFQMSRTWVELSKRDWVWMYRFRVGVKWKDSLVHV